MAGSRYLDFSLMKGGESIGAIVVRFRGVIAGGKRTTPLNETKRDSCEERFHIEPEIGFRRQVIIDIFQQLTAAGRQWSGICSYSHVE
jgi:hypothetical protein